MSFADTSGVRLAWLAEASENQIPATPSWQNLRYTSESLRYNKQTVVSEEIRPDRNIPDVIDVGFGVGGDIGFEMSYGTFDTLLESLLFSTWSGDVLKNGVSPKSIAFEKTFETGATDRYFRFTGCQIGAMDLQLRARERVTGTFSNILGMGHSKAEAAISGATYTESNTKAIMSASGDVGTLSISGVSPSPVLMSMNINIANNLRERLQIGDRGPAGIGAGRCVVTASLEAYFQDLGIYNAFFDHDDVGASITIGSVSGEKYNINMPRGKLMNGNIVTPGNDQDVMATFDFQAIYDTSGSPANNASILLTRAIS